MFDFIFLYTVYVFFFKSVLNNVHFIFNHLTLGKEIEITKVNVLQLTVIMQLSYITVHFTSLNTKFNHSIIVGLLATINYLLYSQQDLKVNLKRGNLH
jgi:hypothetical protein